MTCHFGFVITYLTLEVNLSNRLATLCVKTYWWAALLLEANRWVVMVVNNSLLTDIRIENWYDVERGPEVKYHSLHLSSINVTYVV